MADHRQSLHQLLKQNQEPFHLKTYIAERRSQLKKPPPKTTLHITKQRPLESSTCFTKPINLCKHPCFFSLRTSPDGRQSPFLDLPSPLKSPYKPPKSGPKHHHQYKTAGLGLFGSFLKRLKERGPNKKRAIRCTDLKLSTAEKSKLGRKYGEIVCISRHCDENDDFEASTSECAPCNCSDDFGCQETLFCASPFRFSLQRSPSSGSGISTGHTPNFFSPVTSPCRPVVKENDEHESENPTKIEVDEQDEKEQCSPVSILDAAFEEDGHESGEDDEEDDYNLECSYVSVQKAKLQLLHRLRRFEKLAELDPIELERRMLESSDEELEPETNEESESYDDPSLLHDYTSETGMANNVNLQDYLTKVSTDVKRLDGKAIFSSNKEFDSVRFCDMLDTIIDMDFKDDFCGWRGFLELVEETTAEIELEIFDILVKELSGELLRHETN